MPNVPETKLIASHKPAGIRSDWVPAQGWLMLTPVELPAQTESGLFLPESVTKKSTSGLCVRVHGNTEYDVEDHLGKEIYFPANAQYRIKDSETGEEFYVLPINQVILTRVPPPEALFYQVPAGGDLMGRGDGMLQGGIATLQSNKD